MFLELPQFDCLFCNTVEEACSLLSKYKGDAQVLAGGTDLLVKMKHRKTLPAYLINIKKIPDLDTIRYDEAEGLRIGALTTIHTLRSTPLIVRRFPVLGQAAGVLGTAHVRNLATLGGNLCNASPASECSPPLLTLEGRAKIVGLKGERIVPLDTFFVGPGKSVLQSDEVLTEIQIPNLPPNAVGVHIKHGTRRVDVAIASVSVVMVRDGDTCQDIRIALGAVGPTPFRARKAESTLRGQKLDGESGDLVTRMAKVASDESVPIDDIRGEADFRRQLVENLVGQAVKRAVEQSKL